MENVNSKPDNAKRNLPLVVGISGGSGAGKTTIVNAVARHFGEQFITVIPQDSYYRDFSNIPFSEHNNINFDEPDAIEFELLINHLLRLMAGETVISPRYDFLTHVREAEGRELYARPLIIVEGILIFCNSALCDLCEIKLFIDTDSDLRIIRRLRRDVKERGLSFENTIDKYLQDVREMHFKYVEPSKRSADLIIPWHDFNETACRVVIDTLEHFLMKAGARIK